LAILDYDQGESISSIARRLGVTRQTVYNWIASYVADHDAHSLGDAHRPGRPTLWTEDLRSVFQALLEKTPDQVGYFAGNWTVPLLQDALADYADLRPSEDTVRRELDRLRYVWKRPRYVLEPDPEREKKTPDPQANPGTPASECGVG
jgi:transposase